jgi:hypothetical protein
MSSLSFAQSLRPGSAELADAVLASPHQYSRAAVVWAESVRATLGAEAISRETAPGA